MVAELARSRVGRGLFSVLTGTAIGQGLTIAVSPLLTRLYTSDDFGALAVLTSVVSILAVVSTVRLEAAVILPAQDDDAAAVAWVGMLISAMFGTLLLIMGVLFGHVLESALHLSALDGLWWLVAATVSFAGIGQVLSAWLTRQRQYGRVGFRNVAMGVGQATAQVSLGLYGVHPLGLLSGLVVGRAAGCGGLISRGGLLRQRFPTLLEAWNAANRYRRFPLVATWSGLLNVLGAQAPLLIVSAVYGQATVGLVGLTVRVLAAPVALIGQAVSNLYRGEVGVLVRTRSGSVAASTRQTVKRLLLLGLVPTAGLLLGGPALFGLVFGDSWSRAGEYAQLLSVGYLAQFVVSPVSQSLMLLERQDAQLCWDAGRLVIAGGIPTICALVGLPVTVVIVALSASQVVSYLALYVTCIRLAKWRDNNLESA